MADLAATLDFSTVVLRLQVSTPFTTGLSNGHNGFLSPQNITVKAPARFTAAPNVAAPVETDVKGCRAQGLRAGDYRANGPRA
jgi:hypothetical protein